MIVTFTVGERQCRGLTYLESGQSLETWLPRGAYTVVGGCTIADRDGTHRPAVTLHRHGKPTGMGVYRDGREVWYTGPASVPGA